jgi:8-oxo-dGTP pyrophosphatase MutT (NUDIX family)
MGVWCLPGGKVDYGKTVEATVAGELAEELSVRLLPAEFAWYQNSLPQVPGDPHYINFYFHCRIEGEIRLNEESSAFAWIGPADIPNYPIVFRNDEAILRFFSESHPQDSSTSKEGGRQ